MNQVEPARRFSETQPHPWVAVDVVIFSLARRSLQCLLVQIKEGSFAGMWAFPGGLVGAQESLDDAARRELYERTGFRQAYLEQLYTFGKPERDPATRAVSVSYLALAPYSKIHPSPGEKYAAVRWFSAARLPSLAYDHDQVARLAAQRLRSKLHYTNIVYNLLAREFTLGEVQEVYETILRRLLDRRNFRKKILASGLLSPLKKVRKGPHRPASLYTFKQKRLMVIEML